MLHALHVLAASGVFTLTDRTEVRVRNPDPVTNAAALDADTVLNASATVTLPHSLYTLAYTPQLSLLDVNAVGVHPTVLHAVLAAADWHSRRVRVTLAEHASYGDQSLTSLYAAPAPGATTPPANAGAPPAPLAAPTLVPVAQSLRFASSDTSLATNLDVRPFTLGMAVGYRLSGGADAAAEQVLPFQRGPYGQATVDYRAGARDHLGTSVNASQSSFSPGGAEVLLAQAEEQWRHHWARRTDTTLGAGAYIARVRTSDVTPLQSEGDPTASAALMQGFSQGPNHEQLRFEAHVAPLINPLLGTVDERFQGAVEALWSRKPIMVSVFATGSDSLRQGTPASGSSVSAEVDVKYQTTETISFDAGARQLYQVQNGLGAGGTTGASATAATSFSQTLVFAAVTVQALRTPF